LATLLEDIEGKGKASSEDEELDLTDEIEEDASEPEIASQKQKFEFDQVSLDLYLNEIGETALLTVEETNALAHQIEDAKHLERLQKEWTAEHGLQPSPMNLLLALSGHVNRLDWLFESLCRHLGLTSGTVAEKMWDPELRSLIDGQINQDGSAAVAGIAGMGQDKAEAGMVELSVDSRLVPWDIVDEAGKKKSLSEFCEALQSERFRDKLESRSSEIAGHFQRIREEARQARRQMIQANLRLVVSVARGHMDWGVPLPDLIQEGNIGLMQAVRKFDLRRGCKFSTYAIPWIWQAINRAANEQGRIVHLPGHVVDDLTKLSRARNNLTQKFGRQPKEKELASETGLPLKKVESLLKVMSGVPVSLDAPVGEDGSEIGDFVPDEKAVQPEEESNASLLREELRKIMESLTPRERRVIELRFGLGGEYGRTLVEVGAELGLSKERIRQIEKEALAKLRHRNHSRELIGYLG